MSTSFEQHLGDEFVKGTDQITKPNFSNFNFWGVYYSASWCGPCRQFTPMLAKFYESIKEHKQFEIVWVSHDEDQEQFNRYNSKMPWLAIPWKERFRANILNRIVRLQTIPYLCIFDQQGQYVTCSAREHILEHGLGAWQLWEQLAVERQEQRTKEE